MVTALLGKHLRWNLVLIYQMQILFKNTLREQCLFFPHTVNSHLSLTASTSSVTTPEMPCTLFCSFQLIEVQ